MSHEYSDGTDTGLFPHIFILVLPRPPNYGDMLIGHLLPGVKFTHTHTHTHGNISSGHTHHMRGTSCRRRDATSRGGGGGLRGDEWLKASAGAARRAAKSESIKET